MDPEKSPEEEPVEKDPANPPAEKTEKEEPTDNAERSRLGRVVSEMKAGWDAALEKISALEAEIETLRKPAENEDEVVYTKSGIQQILKDELTSLEKQRVSANQAYNKKYAETIGTLSVDISDKDFDKIIKIANHATRPTGNPVVDAKLNFSEAALKHFQGGKNPLKETDPKNLGGGPRTASETETPSPKLSGKAQELVKAFGMSDEAVKRALKE